jgi:hypothetical protein
MHEDDDAVPGLLRGRERLRVEGHDLARGRKDGGAAQRDEGQ